VSKAAYLIVKIQTEVVKFYTELHKYDINGFHEYYKKLRNAFGNINVNNYRGLSRQSLSPIPKELKENYKNIEEPQAQFLMNEIIENSCAILHDDDIDMIINFQDCINVYNKLENKSIYEIIRTSIDDTSKSENFLGFDIGYWGGDNFSIISDSILLPMWHGAQTESYQDLSKFVSLLNDKLLFSNYYDATTFRNYYLSQEWAEKEINDGQICIQKIELIKDF